MTPDGRLGALAEQIVVTLDANVSAPPEAAIDLWAHDLGLFEPTPHLIVLAQSDVSTLSDRVRDELEHRFAEQRYTHFGAATLERNGTVFTVLVLTWRWATITPVPRALAADATIKVTGELTGGLHTPQFVVSLPDGTSDRRDPQQGTKFALSMEAKARGEYRVELLADSEFGETVVANFPVYVGVPPTTYVTVDGGDGAAGGAVSEAQSQQRLLALINEDRKRAGLPALASQRRAGARGARSQRRHADAQLHRPHLEDDRRRGRSRQARRHSHVARARKHRARLQSGRRAPRVDGQPGSSRQRALAEATDVGIGVVLTPEDQRTAYLVTEVFGRFARKIDVDDATSELFERIDRERARRGLRPLTHDDTMSELCARAARRYFEDPHSARQPLVEQLNREAMQKKLRYTRLGALMTVVTGADEAAGIDALLDPQARALGLGLAQGTRADTYEDAIAVVILIGS